MTDHTFDRTTAPALPHGEHRAWRDRGESHGEVLAGSEWRVGLHPC